MNINHLFTYDGFDDPVNHFCAGWVEMGGFTTPKRFRKGQTFQNRERLGLTGMRHGFHVTGRPAALPERLGLSAGSMAAGECRLPTPPQTQPS
jgi:hypothetical protein